jgi:hypothetical protein
LEIHIESTAETRKSDRRDMETPPPEPEDAMCQPAIEPLPGKRRGQAEATEKKVDQWMGETREARGDIKTPCQRGHHGNQNRGQRQRQGLAQPEGCSKDQDRQPGTDPLFGETFGHRIDGQPAPDQEETDEGQQHDRDLHPRMGNMQRAVGLTNQGLLVMAHDNRISPQAGTPLNATPAGARHLQNHAKGNGSTPRTDQPPSARRKSDG